jgi:hypothetical protein
LLGLYEFSELGLLHRHHPVSLESLILPDYPHIRLDEYVDDDDDDNDDYASISACLLVMDDNHFLIEWLAYHYEVLPLRRLIVARDPRSRMSLSHILRRWKGLINITEWQDDDYFHAAWRSQILTVGNNRYSNNKEDNTTSTEDKLTILTFSSP